MLIGPHIACGWPLGQQIGVLPPQLAGALNCTTPFMPPARSPSSLAGSAVIAASPLCETRSWAALGLRSAAGKPPGMGSNVPQPPQPPPPHETANTSEVTTTTQSI